MKNKVLLKEDARKKIKEGVDLVANPVKITLGAGGKNVLCIRDNMMPVITKDGVSIAQEVQSDDPIVNAGALAVKQVAKQTNDLAGDGCQDLNSRILTPYGFRRFGDLIVGDEICGTNGTFQTVEGIFPKGVKQLYKFTFSDGRVTEACESHVWRVITNYGAEKNLTTKQLLESGKVSKLQTDNSTSFGYYIPNTFVEFKEKEPLLLDPYLLGALLGDGSLSGTGAIELSLGKNKEHILEKLILPENATYTSNWVDKKNYFRVKFKMIEKEVGGISLTSKLKEIGLFGTTSHTKFIPENYLYGSLETRTKLFQGLMDTDGYKNDRGLYAFSSVNKKLAEQVLELFRSLGKTAKIRTIVKKGADSYANNAIYEVAERQGYKYGIKLKSIELTNKFVEVQCIKVSNKDSLYITEDYIVTHNTTTSTVLAQAIINEADKELSEGANPISLKRGIDKASEEVIKNLRQLSQKSSNIYTLKNIARISANGDKEISDLVVGAINKVTKDGVIKVEEVESIKSEIETTNGYEFDSPISSYMFITNEEKITAEFEDMNVLLYEGYIEDFNQLDAAIKAVYKDKFTSLLIIADQISTPAERQIIKFKTEGAKIMSIKSPSFGSRRTEVMQDIASVIGARVYKQDELSEVTEEGIGKVKKVISDLNKTILIGGVGNTQERIEVVKKQTKTIQGGKKEKDFVKERLGKLTGGIAIIKVGGYSPVERREKTDRVEDALCAVRACLEEGFVAGGGATYLQIAEKLKTTDVSFKNKDEEKGFNVVIRALSSPFKQIMLNSGIESEKIENTIRTAPYGQGFNLITEQIEDLLKAGVIDPTKVSRLALLNATNISGMFLSVEAIVYNNTPIFGQNAQVV